MKNNYIIWVSKKGSYAEGLDLSFYTFRIFELLRHNVIDIGPFLWTFSLSCLNKMVGESATNKMEAATKSKETKLKQGTQWDPCSIQIYKHVDWHAKIELK